MSDVLKPNDATKRTLRALLAQLQQQTSDPTAVQTVKRNIHELCETTMAALTNFVVLFTNPQKPSSEQYSTYEGRPYQIFGFDVLIDANLKAWLLEINTNPGMDFINCRSVMACDHR